MRRIAAASSRRLPSLGLVLTTIVISATAALAMMAAEPPVMQVDSQEVVSDVPAVTVGSKAYIPLRPLARALGADMTYDAHTGTITILHGDDRLRLRINDHLAYLNGNRMTLKHAPFVVRGRTMVGLHVVGRAFGMQVSYDPILHRIAVTTPGIITAGTAQTPGS